MKDISEDSEKADSQLWAFLNIIWVSTVMWFEWSFIEWTGTDHESIRDVNFREFHFSIPEFQISRLVEYSRLNVAFGDGPTVALTRAVLYGSGAHLLSPHPLGINYRRVVATRATPVDLVGRPVSRWQVDVLGQFQLFVVMWLWHIYCMIAVSPDNVFPRRLTTADDQFFNSLTPTVAIWVQI